MPGVLGTALVVAVLVLLAGLAVRSVWKGHKSGKSSCGGDCSHCKGCR